MKQLDTPDQYSNAVNAPGVTIVKFTANWCGPCKRIQPIIDQWANGKFSNVHWFKVDVDINEEVCEHMGISSMPTFLISKNGVLLERLEGANSAGLEALIVKVLSQEK